MRPEYERMKEMIITMLGWATEKQIRGLYFFTLHYIGSGEKSTRNEEEYNG